MRWNSLKNIVALFVVMALAIPAFARDINRIVSLTDETKISGKTLKAGDYTFKVADNKLTIEVNHKVVAEAAGRWEPRDSKWPANAFVTGADGQVQEIRLAGEKGVFIVNGQ
jgi:hypothetical protein